MAIIQFPQGFVWGTATASYQIEGAYDEDGRGLSIWDTFSRTPGKVRNGDNGDVACDSYHRYEEDIALIKQLGVSAYRFSIAWPRIIPDGDGAVNPKGLAYYHTFIDKLLEAGVEPYVTIYHWDLPQALQDKGGWLNRATIDAFVRYSEVLFKAYGGKVKKWFTINEPWCASFLSYTIGEHAPGYRDLQMGVDAGHHLMVAHGKTVLRFRELGIPGEIGFAPNVSWKVPYSNRPEDVAAARREMGWTNDWFLDPVFKGEYPQYLIDVFAKHGAKLHVEPGDMELIREPVDFYAINYYSGNVVRHKEGFGLFDSETVDYGRDHTEMGWVIMPEGLSSVLLDLKQKYGDIPVYISENGACYNDEPGPDGRVRDDRRIDYLRSHIVEINRAIASGVNLKGYFVWSLLDNFEWAFGYEKRFGIVHVNYRTLKRTPKDSYYWYQKVAKNNWFEV
jgi:beta-glucosidase